MEVGGMARGAAGGSTDHTILARMGGSTYIFSSPWGPCAPAEATGFPELFMEMWTHPHPRGQASDKYQTCPPLPFTQAL